MPVLLIEYTSHGQIFIENAGAHIIERSFNLYPRQ